MTELVIYIAIVYFSWAVGFALWLGLFLGKKRSRGGLLMLSGMLVQLGAGLWHLSEERRLSGTPDALYA